MQKYKFSVVIPIYNVEKYLEETIESVINQTIGFEDNIQMILVNDGSPDNSECICLKYKETYPDNIIYIKQENAGVSSARNNGLTYAEGEYVNFLDSDDKWESNAFKKVYQFFQEHNDEIDVVACKMRFFEASSGFGHVLNYKFIGDRVIDVNEDYDCVQMHCTSSFIRKEAIKVKFNTRLKFTEDSLFVNRIIIEKCKYGAMSSAIHLYRKRLTKNSAVDTWQLDSNSYNNNLSEYDENMMAYSREKFGRVIPYIQYVLMYEMQWRLKATISNSVLSDEEFDKYKKHIKDILKNIDDEIILKQRYILGNHKMYALSLKHGEDMFSNLIYDSGDLYFNGNVVYSLKKEKSICIIRAINIIQNSIEVCGVIDCPLSSDDYEIYYDYNGELKLLETVSYGSYGVDNKLYYNDNFKVKYTLDREKKNTLKFYIKYKDEEIISLLLNFTVFGRLTRDKYSHYCKKGYMVYKDGESIVCQKHSVTKSIKFELLYYFKNICKLHFKPLVYRTLYHVFKIFKAKPVWLVSDRTTIANDNGMHLFKYLNSLDNLKADVYFVIDKKASDYVEMQKYGKVLAHGSLMYKIKFLLCDKIISSQADRWVTNPFGTSENYYRDLYRFDFVFLQHGVTKDDISSWLKQIDKNINIFVTTAYDEYKSIVNGKYGYDESVVKLTGFPRYDNLVDESDKQIAIMPTWRKSLSGNINAIDGSRGYNASFKDSEYFKFYNNLINDKRLTDCMKKHNYKGVFVVHPSHMKNYIDFDGNDVFTVTEGFADYQKIFKTSKLLISDYSSVPFDFAYLYKPVIYAQFDKESFFSTHIYKEGYFDYERDGFGPVAYDYESTVNTIIHYIENDCKLKSEYSERIDNFYKYHDQKNCERVCEEILALDEE